MAKCRLCQKSGWFLSLNKVGICATCEPAYIESVESCVRVIEQSLKIAGSTKRLDTMLSRYGTALDACRQLRRYEERGIETLSTHHPSEVMRDIRQERLDRVEEWLDDQLLAARVKSQAATTASATVRPYSKLLEKMGDIYTELPDVASVEEIEVRIRREMDSVRLKAEIDRAEKLAFKGQKKRACEAYLDALYLLRTDSTPDEEQATEIAMVESKIRKLGGEVPGQAPN